VRSLYLTLVYLAFFAMGAVAPFALTLGYLWVDTFRPQDVSYAILNAFPLSLTIGAAALGSYVLLDRKAPPRLNATIVLTLLFAAWVTLTTAYFAVAPEAAWRKWDWAIKTILFSVFIQFVIRSRAQIEAFLQVYLFAVAANVMAAGIKTLLGGGGYGHTLGLSGTDYSGMFSESSTLAAVSVMLLPLIYYLRTHTVIFPRSRIVNLGYIGMAVIALAAAVGTFARTGLVGLIVVAAAIWLRSRQKLLLGIVGIAAAAAIAFLTSDAWNARIATIDDYNTESSALARILVWQWTLEFVSHNPFGGGFESYLVNEITLPAPDGGMAQIHGKAYHSIYFEVLGEHGWPGLAMFLSLIAVAMWSQHSVARLTKAIPELHWCRDLARSLEVALLSLLVCGAFIGIAFLPMLWYMFAISAALRQYVARALKNEQAVARQKSMTGSSKGSGQAYPGIGASRRSAT